jgi:DNA repair/transcription protein MET18/MMS19
MVLELLREMPSKFEERHLLPFSPSMRRMLAVACGDDMREVRSVAIAARTSWANLV